MGFIFLSMEDETGIANVIVTPDLYERERLVVTRASSFKLKAHCRIKTASFM